MKFNPRVVVVSLGVLALAGLAAFALGPRNSNAGVNQIMQVAQGLEAAAQPLAAKITARCAGLAAEGEKIACYGNGLEDITKAQDAKLALKVLTVLNAQDDYGRLRCHTLSHAVGHSAYKTYGSVSEAMKYTDAICWSGYEHGVLESYMSIFDNAELLAGINKICTQDPARPYSFDYYNCLHGIGHGVTIRFEQDIFTALPYCDALKGSWEQESCYGGVFMQNIVTDQELHQGKNLKADDPIYPCNAIKNQQKQACYLIQTSNILRTFNYDYQKTFAACDAAESAYIPTCYQSMGRDISGNFLLDVQKVLTYCALGNPQYQGYCYVGASKNAVFNDRATARADALCALVPAQFKDVCIRARDEAAATI